MLLMRTTKTAVCLQTKANFSSPLWVLIGVLDKFNEEYFTNKGLVINYGEGGGYKMGKSRVRNFLRHPLKTG